MLRLGLGLGLAISACVAASRAEDYPARPVTLVVPTAPGGAQDSAARLIASKLGPRFGQPIIVENKTGAGTALGTTYVTGARPDGYTLLMQTNALAALPALQKSARFNPQTDFTYIAKYASSAMALVVNTAALPVKTFDELVKTVREQPGRFNYSSAGIGTQYHLGMEMLKNQLQLKIEHVPFRGGQLAMNALIGGQVEMELATVNDVIPNVASGRLTLLAVSGKNRSQLLPSAPTFDELGLKQLDIDVYFFVAGPAGLPPAITTKLNSEISEAVQDQTMRERFLALGLIPETGSAEELSATVKADVDRWKKFIADANIVTE